jgi:hypothetical protein
MQSIFCLPLIFALIWIIKVKIPVKQIFGVSNAFQWTLLISFTWMTVNDEDLVDT